jgi:hypothetical protein
VFPLPEGFYFMTAATREGIDVRPPVLLAFLDESLLDERIEVRVESPVMDFFLV